MWECMNGKNETGDCVRERVCVCVREDPGKEMNSSDESFLRAIAATVYCRRVYRIMCASTAGVVVCALFLRPFSAHTQHTPNVY